MRGDVVAVGVAALGCALGARAALAADTDPPQIGHQPVKEAAERQRIRIAASIYDASAVFEPKLFYRRAGEAAFLSMSLASSGEQYVATIPEEFVKGDLEYYLEAFDEHGNGPSRHGTADSPHRIRVAGGAAPAAASAAPAPAAAPAAVGPEVPLEPAAPGGPPWLAAGLGVAGLGAGGVAAFQFVKSSQAAANGKAALTDEARKAFEGEAGTAQLFGIGASVAAAALVGAAAYFLFAPP